MRDLLMRILAAIKQLLPDETDETDSIPDNQDENT